MGHKEGLDVMFHPRTVAVIGAPRKRPVGWPGIFGSIRDYGYQGTLYPINPGASEVEGIRAYPDLVSVPEPIDLVIISVPAPAVPAALRDCVASGNKNIHIFTAGFKETGEEEGLQLQAEIETIAREGGLRGDRAQLHGNIQSPRAPRHLDRGARAIRTGSLRKPERGTLAGLYQFLQSPGRLFQ